MFDAIQTACNDYYQAMPNYSLRAVGRSAVFTFTASVIFSNIGGGPLNFMRPATAASVAVLASTINALTTPFFNWIFENQDYKIHQEFIRFIIDVTLIHHLISFATPFKVLTKKAGIGIGIHIFSQNMLLKAPLSALSWALDIINGRGDELRDFCQQRLFLNIRHVTPATYFTI